MSVRIQVDTRKDAVTVPPAAVQRGPQGLYAWVISRQYSGASADRGRAERWRRDRCHERIEPAIGSW